MDQCDVLVVGAGPAGSTCAWRLREAGVDVLVVDKEPLPRDKVCGGWVTPAVFRALGLDPQEYRQDHVLQPVSRFLTSVIGGPAFETVYSETVSYGVWRREFDNFLLHRSGARYRDDTPIRAFKWETGEWLVNGEIRCRMIVGAGGHFCPVARHFGSRPSMEEAITAQETEWEMDEASAHICSIRGNTPELYFSPDLHGYGWCFRKRHRLNVGYGHAGHDHISRQVDDFRNFLQTRRCIGAVLPPKFRGHAYLLRSTSTRRLIADGALLVGDAAGLAIPPSGEGILPAVESGLLAAETILAAKGVYKERSLVPYQTAIEQRFGPAHANRFAQIANAIPPPLLRAVGKRLLSHRGFVRDHLLSHWFLHLDRDPLVLAG